MISTEDCVEMERYSLKKYIENSSERLLKAVEGKRILGDGKTKKKILKKRENFMNKSFHS